MNIAAMNSLATGAIDNTTNTLATSLKGVLGEDGKKADGTLFDAFLNSAMDNIKTTNNYLSNMENEEIKLALGESATSHDLTIATSKAYSALQYTVAIKNKLMDAYKEIMQIQI